MKSWILAFGFTFISFFIEISALSVYTNISVPLSLIALIFSSVKCGELVGEILGFVLGLMLDIVSGTPLGFYALSYLTIGFLFGLWRKEALVNSWFASLFLFIGARGILLVFSLLLAIFFEANPWESIGWSGNFLLGLIFCPLYMSFLNFLGTVLSGKRIIRDTDF